MATTGGASDLSSPDLEGQPPVGEENIWRRGLAWAIDLFLLNGFNTYLFLPVLAQFGLPQGPLTAGLAILGVTGSYFIGLWTWSGQTLGKKVLGLRVVRADGRPVGLRRAALRYGTYVAMTVTFFLGYLFSALFVLYTARHQGLHDLLAGTLVVSVR